ncbi:MAG: hypothetical protein P8M73_02355 [Luminiphilus sp.]|nr:hypothetical protein [Luminiphilus sp.]
MKGDWRDSVVPTLALFGSASTLLCCALPALLISIGAGAVMAGLTSAIPGIIWLSTHKDILFLLSGLMMVASTGLWWQQRNAPCPVDPIKAAACTRLRQINKWLLSSAWLAYICGIFFAYLWARLFY